MRGMNLNQKLDVLGVLQHTHRDTRQDPSPGAEEDSLSSLLDGARFGRRSRGCLEHVYQHHFDPETRIDSVYLTGCPLLVLQIIHTWHCRSSLTD
ncbi:hypothetical protein BofuT4_uP001550.1 [Botrytis cinerea T4]|uniref:Uncharacterized protein n=1 Tax=Botryotinia fuckeliana (strain T4) TaxID=999810 RepID=G2YM60_BOTF4|nr:hypothetical protein BofuT4_uP001550.1 [Botrytis cinerea T4]